MYPGFTAVESDPDRLVIVAGVTGDPIYPPYIVPATAASEFACPSNTPLYLCTYDADVANEVEIAEVTKDADVAKDAVAAFIKLLFILVILAIDCFYISNQSLLGLNLTIQLVFVPVF